VEDACLVVCDTVFGPAVFNILKECNVSVFKVSQPATVTVLQNITSHSVSHPRRLASGALPWENRCCIWLAAVSKLLHHISQETFCSLCWDCLILLSFQQA